MEKTIKNDKLSNCEQDLISVIIPIYNMEKFIRKCLDSVLASTYKNLEVICVDDCSPDSSMDIVKEFADGDDRIKIVSNPENYGLFRTRVSGMKVATGEYICFVDADDFVGVDWFRLLHKKISEEKSDMVIGNTVSVDENLVFTYDANYRGLTASHKTLYGKDVLDALLRQEGACFAWHTVWNKLYTRRLIEECMPFFEKIDFHMIMGEDIAYSSVLYTHAKSLAFANADAYFYYRHSEASTSISLPIEKILKNIKDLKKVFDYFEECMQEYDSDLYRSNIPAIQNFKDRYHRIWSGNLYNKGAQKDSKALAILKETFGRDDLVLPYRHDFYFYEQKAYWSHKYEELKKSIVDEEVEVVSFDIFDTLLLRPTYDPTDIYLFVGKSVSKILSYLDEKSFSDMRIIAEENARKKIRTDKMMYEDVTLTEIYDSFAELMQIDIETARKIQNIEEATEISLCYPRNAVKELFELARAIGKKVILTSDMYLEKSTLEKMLHKCGYTDYDRLYVSSDWRVLKSTGRLFDAVINDMDTTPDKIIHIGDNWSTDITCAQNKGMKTGFIPNTKETFENLISDIYLGEDLCFYKFRKNAVIENEHILSDFGVKCMLATAINKFCDNPFKSFIPESNYHAENYLTGYYTLGMHISSVAMWMLEIAKKNNYKKIVFFARDGYLIKKAFDELVKNTGDKIETEYFCVTRKSLLPFSIKSEKDFYSISKYVDIYEHTPRSILSLLAPILKPMDSEIEENYFDNGIILDKKFENKNDFLKFTGIMAKISYDYELCSLKREEIRLALEKIFHEETVTFDIGYSGRLQTILCDIIGRRIDTMFIHSNGHDTKVLAKDNFEVHCFYEFTPSISGIIREFIISENAPSCIGYELENGNIIPVFEKKDFAYDECYALNELHKGAVDFAKDYFGIMSSYINELPLSYIDASLPFEYYLLNASYKDRLTFSASFVEDEVYGGYERKCIYDIWEWHLGEINKHAAQWNQSTASVTLHPFVQDPRLGQTIEAFLEPKSKFKRALFFWLFDRKKFKEKLKKNIKS